MHILAINPGATSTKIAAFDDGVELFHDELDYPADHFAPSDSVFSQFDERVADVEHCLEQRNLDFKFDAVVGRGGLIGPVGPGAYAVDDAFEDRVRNRPTLQHASNLGGPMARAIARRFGTQQCPALIYDPVTVDEMSDVARITGIAGVQRESVGHHLNMRAVAIDLAQKLGLGYPKASIIVLHMGGGSSASAHQNGVVVDFISDDEMQFSAERSGGLALKTVTRMIKETSVDQFNRKVRTESGLRSHVGTTDMRVLEKRIADGDEYAALVLEALALQIGKAMASLAVTLNGHVDALILTGGMAHSASLCQKVGQRTAFIAPLYPYPGESEMPALAGGARRVLSGQEPLHRLDEYHPIQLFPGK